MKKKSLRSAPSGLFSVATVGAALFERLATALPILLYDAKIHPPSHVPRAMGWHYDARYDMAQNAATSKQVRLHCCPLQAQLQGVGLGEAASGQRSAAGDHTAVIP